MKLHISISEPRFGGQGGLITLVRKLIGGVQTDVHNQLLFDGRLMVTHVLADCKEVGTRNIHMPSHDSFADCYRLVYSFKRHVLKFPGRNYVALGDFNFSDWSDIHAQTPERCARSDSLKQLWDGLFPWAEIDQPLPTRFCATSAKADKLDRCYVNSHSCTLVQSQISFGTVWTFDHAYGKASDHIPVLLCWTGMLREPSAGKIPSWV